MQSVWTDVTMRPSNRIGRGNRVQDFDQRPTGLLHAGEDDADATLCGLTVLHRGGEYPTGFGARCRDCIALVNADAQQ
jgi:hypothetical protein